MVETAFQASKILREQVMPFLLRRTKKDVQELVQLPPKQEQVLFCDLSPQQYQVYLDFLRTDRCKALLNSKNNSVSKDGTHHSFFVISVLRKLTNHPDLLLRDHKELVPTDYGDPSRSGKMIVLEKILSVWKKQGHKVILFTQTVQMLEILQEWLENTLDYRCDRMDGTTPVSKRTQMIDNFNESEVLFIMIMTTRVGGIGLNITGANRVILFDPDWNPMTDVQARERAWRIGQKRDVTVYRLISTGTIEEKIYHKQVFKHFLSQKILSDPRQKRFMKKNDVRDMLEAPPAPKNFDSSKLQNLQQYSSIFKRLNPTNTLTVDGDVETVKLLGHMQAHASDSNLNEAGDGESKEEHQKILKDLLDPVKGLVRGSFSHDAVENPVLEESLFLHGQTRAKQTIQVLQESREKRRQFAISEPTWTGRLGKAGKDTKLRNIAISNGNDLTAMGMSKKAQIDPETGARISGSTATERARLERESRLKQISEDRRLLQERKQRFESLKSSTDARHLKNGLDQLENLRALRDFRVGGMSTQTEQRNNLVYRHKGVKGRMMERHAQNKEMIEKMQKKAAEDYNMEDHPLGFSHAAKGHHSASDGQYSSTRNLSNKSVPMTDRKLAEDILCYFLNDRTCPQRSSTTNNVQDHFEGRVNSDNKQLFRDLLNEICEKEKSKFGPAIWTLKKEFLPGNTKKNAAANGNIKKEPNSGMTANKSANSYSSRNLNFANAASSSSSSRINPNSMQTDFTLPPPDNTPKIKLEPKNTQKKKPVVKGGWVVD